MGVTSPLLMARISSGGGWEDAFGSLGNRGLVVAVHSLPGFEQSYLTLQITSSRACSCIFEMALLADASWISMGPLAYLRLMCVNACDALQS